MKQKPAVGICTISRIRCSFELKKSLVFAGCTMLQTYLTCFAFRYPHYLPILMVLVLSLSSLSQSLLSSFSSVFLVSYAWAVSRTYPFWAVSFPPFFPRVLFACSISFILLFVIPADLLQKSISVASKILFAFSPIGQISDPYVVMLLTIVL